MLTLKMEVSCDCCYRAEFHDVLEDRNAKPEDYFADGWYKSPIFGDLCPACFEEFRLLYNRLRDPQVEEIKREDVKYCLGSYDSMSTQNDYKYQEEYGEISTGTFV